MDADRKQYYESEMAKVLDLAQRRDGAAAVREAGRLFEELLRGRMQYYVALVPFQVRKAIFDAELEIGKGNKGMGDFQFGQLVGLWRTSRLVEAIGEVEGRSARTLAGVDLNLICDMRNDCVHNSVVPDDHEVEYVISALRTYLGFFGVTVTERQVPRSVTDFSDLMRERFSSVEIIEGTSNFYRRLTEIVSQPEIDTYDLTNLVELPPKGGRGSVARDPVREYFEITRRKVLAGEAGLRRIVTFNTPVKAAWILFNMVGGHQEVFEDNMHLATFDANRSNGAADIMLPNVVLYYSSDDISNGTAWIYSHQQHDSMNFIGLNGEALFLTMRRLYLAWYRSCDRLTEERAAEKFIKFFGRAEGVAQVRAIADKYRAAIMMDDDALDKSVDYWVHMIERHAPRDT